MTTFTATAEGYADGQDVTTATVSPDTPWANVVKAGAATIKAETSGALKGTKSFLLIPDTSVAANGCSFQWTLGSTFQVVARFYMMLTSPPSAACHIVRLWNASITGATLVLSTNNGLNITNNAGTTVYTGANLQTNVLYRVELSLSNGSGSTDDMVLNVYRGNSTTAIPENSTVITDSNFGTGALNRFYIGKLSTATMGPLWLDDIAVQDGTLTLLGPTTGSPTAPTAAFSTFVTGLTAAVTNTSVGAGLSYAWAFGDGTTSVAQTPTHTYATDGTYTIALTTTDAIGATATVSHSVVVSSTFTVPTSLTATSWVNNGGAASALAAIQDSTDSTYIEFTSPNNTPLEGAAPLTVATSQGIDVTIRCRRTTSTSGTMTVILKQGSVVKATKTGIAIPATTFADVVVSFLPSDLTTFTDFSQLVVHADVTAA